MPGEAQDHPGREQALVKQRLLQGATCPVPGVSTKRQARAGLRAVPSGSWARQQNKAQLAKEGAVGPMSPEDLSPVLSGQTHRKKSVLT